MTQRRRMIFAGGIASVLLAGTLASGGAAAGTSITIADKGFSESALITQLYAKALAANGFNVTVKSLGSSAIADAAVRKGDIDLYPEYTETAYVTILKRKRGASPAKVAAAIKAAYAKRGLTTFAAAPFNNDNEVACTQAAVKKYKLSTLSSLAKVADKITYSANPEHLTRADGLPLLATAYGIDFKGRLKVVDISLRYRPIQQKKADCVYAFGTDPLKKKLGLVTLRDDKNLFNGYYQSFPVANSAYVASAPANLGAILNKVTAALTGNDAIDLLTKIDIDKEDPADVASAFLKSKGLI